MFRLQDLRRLSLANNLIEKLAHRVFYKVSKLKYLDLSGNPLADLPPDVFTDITVRKNRLKNNTRLFYSTYRSRCNHITRIQKKLLLSGEKKKPVHILNTEREERKK